MTKHLRAALILIVAVSMTGLMLFAQSCDPGDECAPPANQTPALAPTQAANATTATAGDAIEPVAPEWVAVENELDGPQAAPQLFAVRIETGEMWRLGDAHVPGAPVRLWPLAWSPDGELLVAVRTEEGADLFLAEPGSPFGFVATIGDLPVVAAWSPDGETVAFEAGDARLLFPATGETLRGPLLESARTITWSGDGQFVAFATVLGLEPEVVVWEWTSGRTQRLRARSGVWSHDGARFAYVPAGDVRSFELSPHEIRVRDFNANTDDIVTTIVTSAAEPVGWSTDDSLIAIEANTDIFTTYIVSAGGESDTIAVHGTWPSNWLGDEQTILLSGNVCNSFDVATVNGDGSHLQHHTDNEKWELDPLASPGGEHVVFTVLGRGEPDVIRMLTLATGETRDLAIGSGLTMARHLRRSELVWSPDGRYVTFGVTEGYDFCLGFPPQTTVVELLP